MRSLRYAPVLATLLLAGCPPARSAVQCGENGHCDLDPGGVCTSTDIGESWCAYPDKVCPSGYRYSDFYVGDEVSGICVPEAARRTLTVQLGGKGAGSVASEPAGLTCSEDTCTGQFLVGATVKLSAAALTGSFLGWIDGCRGTDACEVAMDNNRSVGALFGNAGEALWVRQLGGPGSDRGTSITVDSQGNLIAIGTFSQTLSLAENATLVSAGGTDIYVVKLTPRGEFVWAKGFGGALNDNGAAVTVDEANNIYVVGGYQGSIDFGGGVLQAIEMSSGFALKLDTNGDYSWARSIDSNGRELAASVAVKEDNVVVVGHYSGVMALDPTKVVQSVSNTDDIFAVKVSASTGSGIWIKSFGGADTDQATGVAIDNSNNVVLVGIFRGSVDFSGTVLDSGVGGDVLLLKLNTEGMGVFARHSGGVESAIGRSVAIDSANNIVVMGSFVQSVSLGCSNQHTDPVSDTLPNLFLAKYTQAGACVWSQAFISTNRTFRPRLEGVAVAVNSFSDISTTSSFGNTISFGGPPFASAGVEDAFAARFSADGGHVRSVRFGGTSNDVSAGIAQFADNRQFVIGSFVGLAEFTNETLTSAGDSDVFVVGLAP